MCLASDSVHSHRIHVVTAILILRPHCCTWPKFILCSCYLMHASYCYHLTIYLYTHTYRQPIKDIVDKAAQAFGTTLDTVNCSLVGDVFHTVYSSVCDEGKVITCICKLNSLSDPLICTYDNYTHHYRRHMQPYLNISRIVDDPYKQSPRCLSRE